MGISGRCGRCTLCDNHGSHNSIGPLRKDIRTSHGEHRLPQKLNCKDYGIYAVCCKTCNNYCVGQTMTFYHKVGLKIEYYRADFATLNIMIIRPHLGIMLNIIRPSLLASLI